MFISRNVKSNHHNFEEIVKLGYTSTCVRTFTNAQLATKCNY
jgi:hypothetical protein